MNVPRISIHAGLGKRLGSLTSHSSVNRAFAIMQPTAGSVICSLDDPLVRELDPRRGNAIVIESAQYGRPWVGGVTRVEDDHASGTARAQLLSLDVVLRERFLPVGAITPSGTAGSIFRYALDAVNAGNGSGIRVAKDIAAGPVYDGTLLTDRTVYGALTALCRETGYEWWVDYDVTETGIDAVASFAPARGADRFAGVTLRADQGGGNVEVIAAGIDMGGALFGLRMVAGQTTTLEAYSERQRVTRYRTSGFQRTPSAVGATATVHGYEIEHSDLGGSPLTRREAVQVAEGLRSAGAIAGASEVLMGRTKTAERVLKLRVTDPDAGLWAQCDAGSVVRLIAPGAFLGEGFDGPVRIVGVQPAEEIGDLVLVCQVLRGRA